MIFYSKLNLCCFEAGTNERLRIKNFEIEQNLNLHIEETI